MPRPYQKTPRLNFIMNSEKLQTTSFLDVGRLLDFIGHDTSNTEIAAILGIGRKRVGEWRKDPSIVLRPFEADRFVTSIGLHPFEVWGWDWLDSE